LLLWKCDLSCRVSRFAYFSLASSVFSIIYQFEVASEMVLILRRFMRNIREGYFLLENGIFKQIVERRFDGDKNNYDKFDKFTLHCIVISCKLFRWSDYLLILTWHSLVFWRNKNFSKFVDFYSDTFIVSRF